MNGLLVVSGWNGGGTEKYVALAADAYRKNGWTPYLALENQPQHKIDEGLFEKTFVLPAGSGEKQSALKTIINESKISFTHLNLWENLNRYNSLINLGECVYLQTYHATLPTRNIARIFELWHPGRVRNRFLHNIGKLIPPIPLICISKKNFVNSRRHPAQRTCIYNGVPLNSKIAQTRRHRELIWVGALNKRKDPLLAISTFLALRATEPGLTMKLYGSGPLEQECINQIARSKTGQSITLHGYSDNPMSQIDCQAVLLVTSLDEGLPYVAIEALAAGCPVVTTNAGACSEAVDQGAGIVVDSRNPGQIGRSLAKCFGSFSEYSSNASRLYASRFNLPDFQNKTSDWIRNLTNICNAKRE